MNIHLAGIGWVTDAPQGHRLRWHYPVDAIDTAGNYLGLPTTIIVERAPVASHDRTEHPVATVNYPVQWWDSHGDITAASVVPLNGKYEQPLVVARKPATTCPSCRNAGME